MTPIYRLWMIESRKWLCGRHGPRLSLAPIVVRLRTDSEFVPPVPWAKLRLPADGRSPAVFADTDRNFYAKGADFVRIFSDMFTETMRTYEKRTPTMGEVAEYLKVVKATEAVLGHLSGCVLLADKDRNVTARRPGRLGQTCAWQKSKTHTTTDCMPEPDPHFRSERAFAYHIMVRHHATCMRLCFGVDHCATASVKEAPRTYGLLSSRRNFSKLSLPLSHGSTEYPTHPSTI